MFKSGVHGHQGKGGSFIRQAARMKCPISAAVMHQGNCINHQDSSFVVIGRPLYGFSQLIFKEIPMSSQSGRTATHSFVRAFGYFTQRYRQWRTLNAIQSLPLDVQKDVGWPTGADSERLPAFWR
jgi:hypothetical protein